MASTTTQQNPQVEEKQATSNKEQIEAALLQYFLKIFTRQALQSNAYYVFRMNNSLEIPLNTVFNDRGVKAITTDRIAVTEALKKSPLVRIKDLDEQVVPQLTPLANKISVKGLKSEKHSEFEELLKTNQIFSQGGSVHFDTEESKLSGVITLQSEEATQSVYNWLKETKFDENALTLEVQKENVYQSLLSSIQAQKKSGNQQQDKSKQSQNKNGGDGKNLNQQSPLVFPMPVFYPPQQYPQNNLEIFGEFQDLYIRRARDEAQNKANTGSQVQMPNVNPQQAMALQAQQFFMMQQMLQQQQMYQMEFYAQSQQGRDNHHYNNNNNNNNNQNNNRRGRRDGGRRNNNNNNNSHSNNQNGNNNNINTNSNSNNNNSNNINNNPIITTTGGVAYQKKSDRLKQQDEKQRKNRLRLDSENFPTLDEDPEEIERKVKELAILKKEDPKRTTFDKVYNRVEIMRAYEQIKGTLKCPTEFLEQFKSIPVVAAEGTFQLEQERPTRKNSSMTPLLQPISAFRKGSASLTYRKKTPPKTNTNTNNRKQSEKM